MYQILRIPEAVFGNRIRAICASSLLTVGVGLVRLISRAYECLGGQPSSIANQACCSDRGLTMMTADRSLPLYV